MKKIFKYTIFTLVLIITSSSLLLAFRPGSYYYCGRHQEKLFEIIKNYNSKENLKFESILPGKDFEDFYNKLAEKKYVETPIYYSTEDCSFGIDILSGKPLIYCKYHGTKSNIDYFYEMSKNNYFHPYINLGLFVGIGSVILSIIITIIKKCISFITG